MEPITATEQKALLESLRRRRAELRESMSVLENALAAPAGEPERWTEHVQSALMDLSADFAEHIELTEGSDGLYRELLDTAPRLADAVAHLTSEHVAIRDLLDDLLASDPTRDVHQVRELGTSLLGRLVRHRQRGSDLVYQAYEVDIGGDT
jgi:hypothetical protein